MKKEDILSEFNSLVLSKWLVLLDEMPLSMSEKAVRVRLAVNILEGIK